MQNNVERILVIWLRKVLEGYVPSVRVSDESEVGESWTGGGGGPGYGAVL